MENRLEFLQAFHEKDPNDTFVTYGLAMEYAKLNNLEEALGWLSKTIELDADYAYAYYQKARLLSETGKNEAATETISEGLAAAERKGDAHAAEELEELRSTFE